MQWFWKKQVPGEIEDYFAARPDADDFAIQYGISPDPTALTGTLRGDAVAETYMMRATSAFALGDYATALRICDSILSRHYNPATSDTLSRYFLHQALDMICYILINYQRGEEAVPYVYALSTLARVDDDADLFYLLARAHAATSAASLPTSSTAATAVLPPTVMPPTIMPPNMRVNVASIVESLTKVIAITVRPIRTYYDLSQTFVSTLHGAVYTQIVHASTPSSMSSSMPSSSSSSATPSMSDSADLNARVAAIISSSLSLHNVALMTWAAIHRTCALLSAAFQAGSEGELSHPYCLKIIQWAAANVPSAMPYSSSFPEIMWSKHDLLEILHSNGQIGRPSKHAKISTGSSDAATTIPTTATSEQNSTGVEGKLPSPTSSFSSSSTSYTPSIDPLRAAVLAYIDSVSTEALSALADHLKEAIILRAAYMAALEAATEAAAAAASTTTTTTTAAAINSNEEEGKGAKASTSTGVSLSIGADDDGIRVLPSTIALEAASSSDSSSASSSTSTATSPAPDPDPAQPSVAAPAATTTVNASAPPRPSPPGPPMNTRFADAVRATVDVVQARRTYLPCDSNVPSPSSSSTSTSTSDSSTKDTLIMPTHSPALLSLPLILRAGGKPPSPLLAAPMTREALALSLLSAFLPPLKGMHVARMLTKEEEREIAKMNPRNL